MRASNLACKRFILLPLLLLLFSSCAFLNAKYDAQKTYAVAVESFTTLLRIYNDFYDRTTPEMQAKCKAEIDPLFRKADKVLQAWGTALEFSDREEWNVTEYHRAFEDLFRQIQDVLLEFGVLR